MKNDAMKAYGDALADLLTTYAQQLTAEAGSEATAELLRRIGSGEEPVVLISQLVPFSVHACHLDDLGNAGAELFRITSGDLH